MSVALPLHFGPKLHDSANNLKSSLGAMVRHILLVALTCTLLLSCSDRDAEIFGQSYDECVLKNARTGGDEASRGVATEICARHFQRVTINSERTQTIAVSRNLRFDQPNYLTDQREDELHIEVQNSQDDRIITEVEVVADFSDKPEMENGKFPADAKITTLTWTFPVSLQPHIQQRLTGTFQGGRAPTANAQMDAYATKVVPFD